MVVLAAIREKAFNGKRLGPLAKLVLGVGLPIQRGIGFRAFQIDHAIEGTDGAIPPR